MTKPEQDRLVDLAAQLADGRVIDWDSIGGEVDASLVERLRQIELLTRGGLAETPRPQRPDSFAHLAVGEALGAGSSATVYRAHDPVIRRDVALKLCRAPRTHALLREARLIAELDHPNIVRIHGAAEQAGWVGYWSELVQGASLYDWRRERGTLSAREVALVGLELCAALAAVHGIGVVHGDLKPANVIRHASGHWVLVDFGSSQRYGGSVATSGTPLFLAPELLEGGAPTPASDLYALGVLLFHLATGRYPYEGEDYASLVDAVRAGARVRLLDLRPDLPAAFVAIVEAALSKDPEARPATAGAFAKALTEVAAGESPRVPRGLVAAALVGALAITSFALRQATTAGVTPAPVVELLRTNEGERALADGDVVAPGDTLALSYFGARPAHVYVINQDSTGALFQLFPLEGGSLANPLPAGERLRLPGVVDGEAVDWRVTSAGGEEVFYVIVARASLDREITEGLEQRRLATREAGDAYLANLDPKRGAGALAPRAAPERVDATAAWVAALEARESDLYVQRFRLRNP